MQVCVSTASTSSRVAAGVAAGWAPISRRDSLGGDRVSCPCGHRSPPASQRRSLWEELVLHPTAIFTTPVYCPVVQPERHILPEFEQLRQDAVARPIVGPGHLVRI